MDQGGDDTVEGYDLHVGGGAGPEQRIGRLIRPAIAFPGLPAMVLSLLHAWDGQGTFQDWSAARSDAELLSLTERVLEDA